MFQNQLNLLYLDLNIYLDYFLGRANGRRPLGEFAFIILKRTFACEFEIVVSGWVVEEVKKTPKEREMAILLTQLRQANKLTGIQVTLDDEKKAVALCRETGVHFADALHYVLALRSGAEILVSNDKDMQNLPQKELEIRDYQNIDL